MFACCVALRRGRSALALLLSAALITAFATSPAEARRHYRHHQRHHARVYSPPFAAMVVDAKTGKVLYAKNENAPRHPASLTKVMTLYLLFEQMQKGRFNLNSRLEITRHAAAQPPTKIGLRPGQSISVDDAIKAIVTRSANDIAVAIAENVGGSESAFSAMMTRKAHALGMTHTTYVNASGLPDDRQITTAHDLTILARAIQDRFPQYYHYFSLRGFHFAGRWIPSHNHLLGKVEGVDGIKTGYTRASGFNLMTSARTHGRHIVAIVLGGTSYRSRDRIMAGLIEKEMPRAYAGRRTAPVIAEQAEPKRIEVATLPPERAVATSQQEQAGMGKDAAENSADEPASLQPLAKTESPVLATATQTAQVQPAPAQRQAPLNIHGIRPVVASADASMPTTTPSAFRWVTGAQPVDHASGRPVEAPVQATAYAAPVPSKSDVRALAPQKAVEQASVEKDKAVSVEAIDPRVTGSTGWVIQLAATEDKASAKEILTNAKRKARVLRHAAPFTEKVSKNGSTFWRARFSGFSEHSAQTACRALKRNGFSCFATRG